MAVKIDIVRDIRTGSGLTLETIRFYKTREAREVGVRYFESLGLNVADLTDLSMEHPFGIHAVHPKKDAYLRKAERS